MKWRATNWHVDRIPPVMWNTSPSCAGLQTCNCSKRPNVKICLDVKSKVSQDLARRNMKKLQFGDSVSKMWNNMFEDMRNNVSECIEQKSVRQHFGKTLLFDKVECRRISCAVSLIEVRNGNRNLCRLQVLFLSESWKAQARCAQISDSRSWKQKDYNLFHWSSKRLHFNTSPKPIFAYLG